jgi:lysophospholipid acyltransferase (LPLAT)-like uncharacterized protein
VQIHPQSYWRLKTWDGFLIPKPFSVIHITFESLIALPPLADAAALADAGARIEGLLDQEPEARP